MTLRSAEARRPRHPRILACLAALHLASSGVGAAPPVPKGDAATLPARQRLEGLVAQVKAAQKAVKSLEADFRQHRESAFLMLPQDSRGVITFAAPDRVRWEYQEPRAISLVIAGDEMTTWFHDLKRVEKVKIGRYSNQVLKYLNASSSLDSLLTYFTVNLRVAAGADPYRLDLEPRFQRVAKRLRSMSLWIDRQLLLPTRVRYVEGDGDLTEYRFENIRLNAVVPEARFRLDLPPDVEVRVLDLERGTASP